MGSAEAESWVVPCLDLVTGMIYDLGMINAIDPIIQAGMGFLLVAVIGMVLSLIGIWVTLSDDRQESQPDLVENIHTAPVKVHAAHDQRSNKN